MVRMSRRITTDPVACGPAARAPAATGRAGRPGRGRRRSRPPPRRRPGSELRRSAASERVQARGARRAAAVTPLEPPAQRRGPRRRDGLADGQLHWSASPRRRLMRRTQRAARCRDDTVCSDPGRSRTGGTEGSRQHGGTSESDGPMIGMVLAAGCRPAAAAVHRHAAQGAASRSTGRRRSSTSRWRNLAAVELRDVAVVVGYRAEAVEARQARARGAPRRPAHPGAQRQGRGVEQLLLAVAGPRPLRAGRPAGQRRHRAPGRGRAPAAGRSRAGRGAPASCSPSTTRRCSPRRR